MSIDLPQSGTVFLPEVPYKLKAQDAELYNWAQSLRKSLVLNFNAMFANDLIMATAMNLGTSGTFVISSGGSIIVTSGIVVTVTS